MVFFGFSIKPCPALRQQLQNTGALFHRLSVPVKAFIPRAQATHTVTTAVALANTDAGIG